MQEKSPQTSLQHDVDLFSSSTNTLLRGDNSDLIYSTAATSTSALYKTTVGEYDQSGTQLSAISLSYQAMLEIEGTIYVVTYNSGSGANTFGTLNAETGVFTQIASGGSVPDAISMAYNPIDGQVYCTQFQAAFGKINLTNGAFTSIASKSDVIYIAIDDAGVCYALTVSPSGSTFGTMNLTNGQIAQISTYGAANYIQDIGIDFETDILYHAYRDGGTGPTKWRTINKTSGVPTDIGNFPAGRSVESFVILGGGEPSNDCPAVTNVNAIQFEGTMAKITWTEPADVTGLEQYKIYDETVLLNIVLPGVTSYVTNGYNFTPGTHTVSVEAIYDDECTPVKVDATFTIKTCGDFIENVDVVYDNDCIATVTWDPVEGKGNRSVLFNGGPMITHPGGGAGGKDASAFTVTGQNIVGSNASQSSGFSIADDFVLASTSTIETMDFFCYQTNSGTTPTITGVYVQIWDGAPNAGGTVIWGNLTTNIMDGVVFSDIYRVTNNISDVARPLFKVTANIGNYELEAGTYWVEVSFTGGGTPLTGPWANPVEIVGSPHTGNGLQKTSTGWQIWNDWGGTPPAGTQEPYALPFVIYGVGDEPTAPKYNVYMGDELVAAGIEETTYTHPDPAEPGESTEWRVTQACLGGGESDAGYKLGICDDNIPPCEPALDVRAEYNPENKEINVDWIGPALLIPTKYEIYRDNVKVGESTYAMFDDDVSELDPGEYKFEYCVLPIYADGDCEGDVEEACIEYSFTIVGIKVFTNNISILPNPAYDHITITAKANFHTVEIVSFLGQTLFSQSNDKNDVTLDISHLSNGVYFVRILSDKGTSVQKFVKK